MGPSTSRSDPAGSAATGPLHERRLAPLLVLFFGIASVSLVVAADRIQSVGLATAGARIEAVGEILTRLGLAHLWIEEHVSGDTVDLQSVYDDLDWCLAATDALQGRPGARLAGTVPMIGPDERHIRADIEQLRRELLEFRALSAERSAGAPTPAVGIGSALDTRYDRIFARATATGRRILTALAVARQRHIAISYRVFVTLVGGWTALVIGASLVLWQRERQRSRSERELAANREHLAQTQRMDALGRVASALAHDMNNYLAAARGHCELIRMRGARDPDQTVTRLGSVLSIIDKITALLDRLATLSRRRPVHRRAIDLNTFAREMEGLLGPALGELIELRLELADQPLIVDVDSSQLEQAVLNLVVNARDAMPEGGTVTISTALEEAPGTPAAVRLSVSDDGPGISPDFADRVFEPFFTSRENQGHSGLGLAVVYQTVSQNHGRVELSSEVGSGTRFDLRFPLSAARLPEAPPAGQEPIGGTERILLVDDNEDFRESLRAYLSGLGYRVSVAAGGDEALALCDQEGGELQLVVSDRIMPGRDGASLREELARRWGLETLLISGRPQQEPGSHLKGRPGDLAWAIRTALDRRSEG